MARLDAEAQATVVRPSRVPTAAEARAYLESLPDLWAKTSDAGRHAIAEAVFERIDVLGANDFTFALTAQARARGWDAALGPDVVRVKEGQSGRGERSQASDSDLFVPAAWRLRCRVATAPSTSCVEPIRPPVPGQPRARPGTRPACVPGSVPRGR